MKSNMSLLLPVKAVKHEYTWFGQELMSAILPCWKEKRKNAGRPARHKGVRGLFPVPPGLFAVENYNYVTREVREGEYELLLPL